MNLRLSYLKIKTALFVLMAFGLSACSPDIFTGDDIDEEVLKIEDYREPNFDCNDLDLSKAVFTTRSFRGLVKCLNANGALKEVSRFVNRLDDRQLGPLVEISNKYVVNSKALYQTKHTFQVLENRGQLKDTYTSLGKFLENKEFITESISFLRHGYSPALLKVLEVVGKSTDNKNLEDAMDLMLNLTRARAFLNVQEELQKSPSLSDASLKKLTDKVLLYLGESREPGRIDTSKKLLEHIADQKLYQALDETIRVLGEGTLDPIAAATPSITGVMKVQLANEGAILKSSSSMFRYLNREILCLKDTMKIKNGVDHALREMTRVRRDRAETLMKRDLPITLVMTNSLCDFPPELEKHYDNATFDLASSDAVESLVVLLKAFYGIKETDSNGEIVRPLVRMVVDGFGDTGPNDNTGFKHFIPVLADLSLRNFLDDFFLLTNLPNKLGREKISSLASFLITEKKELDGVSPYDILTDGLLKVPGNDFANITRSFGNLVDKPDPVFYPLLDTLRTVYYANNAHPYIDMGRDIFSSATQHQVLFETLFTVAKWPEFGSVLDYLSASSQDGRLQQLIDSILTLFDEYAERGRDNSIQEISPPAIQTLNQHDLARSDLVFNNDFNRPSDRYGPCRNLNINVRLDDYTTNPAAYEKQINDYMYCINSDGRHADVAWAFKYMLDEKVIPGPGQKPKSFYYYQVDLFKSLASFLDQSVLVDIARRWFDSIDSGEFFRVMDAIPYFVDEPFNSQVNDSGETVIEPLLKLIAPILSKRVELGRLQEFASDVIERSDLPALLTYFDEIAKESPEPSPFPDIKGFDRSIIKNAIESVECTKENYRQERRADELIDDFLNSVSNWDLVDGKRRKSWSYTTVQAKIEPLFQKMADPSQSVPSRTAIDSLLNVAAYFSLDPGQSPTVDQHFEPIELAEWFHDRANDYQMIPYFYDGQEKPQARLVNTVDRLELSLINADIKYIFKDNEALSFLAILADAWGDEDPVIWPDEIKTKFPYCKNNTGDCPLSLAEAYEEMDKKLKSFEFWVGKPKMPKCMTPIAPSPAISAVTPPEMPDELRNLSLQVDGGKSEAKLRISGGDLGLPFIPFWVKARIFNLRQLMPALKENIPGSTHKNAGGLKMIRDLMFEAHYSTPPNDRDPSKGWKNNLSSIVLLARMGFMRQSARAIWNMDLADPSVKDFFFGFTKGARAPEMSSLITGLITQDSNHEMMWQLIESIFNVLEPPASGGRRAWERKVQLLEQMVYYFMATTSQLSQTDQANPDALLRRLLGIGADIVWANYDYLNRHVDLVAEDFLTSEETSFFLRALYDSPDDTNKAKLADFMVDITQTSQVALDGFEIVKTYGDGSRNEDLWDEFKRRKALMKKLPGYHALKLEELEGKIYDFFAEQPAPGEPDPALKLRLFMGKELDNHVLSTYFSLISRDPSSFQKRILKTLATYIKVDAEGNIGGLKEFIEMVRRTISNSNN